ncbi:MAG: glycosyltransferase, partial [Chitinophagaceae bacterium]
LLDQTKGFKKYVRSLFLRWVYQHVDTAFYVGSQNKAYFEHFGLKGNQLIFSPHSTDNDRFAVNRRDEALALRQRLGIPKEAVLLLYAGKFEPKKDPLCLLHAFDTLKEGHVHLLFTGNGVLETTLREKASISPNRHQIHFLPFQNQSAMPVLYQACNLFCLPSAGPGETWGLAVNEAMASGKAVIVSDKVGCGTDLVKTGTNGAIFKHGDEKDLAVKLLSFLQNKDQLTKFGQASRRLIENWSFDSQVSTILDELNRLS